MLWVIRARLEDAPGAVAAFTARCGEQNVNILSLQIFPEMNGCVVDELVVRTPPGWCSSDLEQLCAAGGIAHPRVAECSPHKLQDEPVRYLQAAQAVTEDPAQLESQLCRLLDCLPVASGPGLRPLVLDDAEGPRVVLCREVPFTDTEVARAKYLRRLASSSLSSVGSVSATSTVDSTNDTRLRVRRGTRDDVVRLVAMHARCSEETIYRRYHSHVPVLSSRMALALLEPTGGFSLLAMVGETMVGIGMLASGTAGPELGLMVEDHWQRRGVGTRLLHELAVEAASNGMSSVTCLTQPGNSAMLSTVRRAGLRAHVSSVDGLTQCAIPVGRLTGRA